MPESETTTQTPPASDLRFAQSDLDAAMERVRAESRAATGTIVAALTGLGVTVPEGGDIAAAVRAFGPTLETLRAQARDGETYRADLIQDTLDQGVRAHGNDFAADTYRTLLAGATITSIKEIRDGLRKSADAALTKLPRVLPDERGNSQAVGGQVTITVPTAAYKIGG